MTDRPNQACPPPDLPERPPAPDDMRPDILALAVEMARSLARQGVEWWPAWVRIHRRYHVRGLHGDGITYTYLMWHYDHATEGSPR